MLVANSLFHFASGQERVKKHQTQTTHLCGRASGEHFESLVDSGARTTQYHAALVGFLTELFESVYHSYCKQRPLVGVYPNLCEAWKDDNYLQVFFQYDICFPFINFLNLFSFMLFF